MYTLESIPTVKVKKTSQGKTVTFSPSYAALSRQQSWSAVK
jgi:hypothetical protein